MILAIIDNTASIFADWNLFHAATFAPDTIISAVFPLRIHGRTYAEKRAHLRRLAIDIQSADLGGISYGELCDLQCFLIRSARKYGLIQEFKQNAII